MSSWDRSRRIPWSRLNQTYPPGEAPDHEKEREQILRSLEKERSLVANQAEEMRKARKQGNTPTDNNNTSSTESSMESYFDGVPYRTPDLLKNIAFGGFMGSLTGAVFGFMDGMKQAGDSKMLQRASTGAKFKFLLQGTTRAGLTFGGFFSGYQTCRYGIRVIADPGDWYEMLIAAPISLGVMFSRPKLRPSVPYAGMLIGMDAFSAYMRQGRSD
mmetsp:Transcript_3813/g.5592  ORF Transcript_3813/g.5592 Transcript_3813/m.5592 type:complete len:215 (-) Transcript_3813:27-671(-)|eukprot:CAMPEP_0195508310 /NCGR_PEP_ID=MMETSP0794_2-20130614/1548_1 /TAXON_ID=515487 /ORGANISM="Stephanopyxis turris, Strain CCMP 815" /LENGTH=214 /DNA_ID=CAMNT_0040635229 /DNA_START=110 /DNA_END=754 /DNA_ORIENTATION=+